MALSALFIRVDLNHLPLSVAISLPVFDMTINLAAGKPLLYLGTTSKTDKLGKWKWIGYGALIVATALI
jgi:hypothetical protein